MSEEEGFSFGDPWTYKNAEGTILPIRRRGGRPRKYRTLEEVLKDTRDAIEVSESGAIRKVRVLNRTDIPIFVRMGTIFSGLGTQSRAAEGSIILVPSKEARPVTVRCVEATVPIRGGTRFEVAGFTAPLSVEMGLYARDQQEVWDRVSAYASERRVRRGLREETAEALHGYLHMDDSLIRVAEAVDAFKEKVDEILELVPNYQDQVGLVFLDGKGVRGLETFDSPKSWEAVGDRIVKKYGEVISLPQGEESEQAEPDKEDAVEQAARFMRRLARSRGKTTFHQGAYRTVALRGRGVAGEYTVMDGDIMHLTGVRFEKRPKKRRPVGPEYVRSATLRDLERLGQEEWEHPHGRPQEEGVREGS
ncbi:MAG: DUF6569 family protein [Thermoplasmata archaeon]|nr:DUF6569 family protein [Thermoplasmata archaeon]